MRRSAVALIITGLVCATPLYAQGRGQAPPPPDHWLTIDSLVTMVQITAAQRAAVTEHYEQINALMKQAAEKRTALRSGMTGPPTEADRERMTAFRDEMTAMQAKIDEHRQAIRAMLTDEQKARFDALPATQLVRPRQRPPQ
jgi:hypothetical protein